MGAGWRCGAERRDAAERVEACMSARASGRHPPAAGLTRPSSLVPNGARPDLVGAVAVGRRRARYAAAAGADCCLLNESRAGPRARARDRPQTRPGDTTQFTSRTSVPGCLAPLARRTMAGTQALLLPRLKLRQCTWRLCGAWGAATSAGRLSLFHYSHILIRFWTASGASKTAECGVIGVSQSRRAVWRHVYARYC